MGEYASVESFQALKRLRTAMCRFAETAGAGLDEAEAELQRTSTWVKAEQSSYWKREGERRAELLARAKSALTRKKLQPTALGGRPSCVEEEQEVALATRRVEEARQKLANVRCWSRRLDEETYSYLAVASGLSEALAADIPIALAQLDNMLTALEAYADTATPPAQSVSSAAGLGAEPEAGAEFSSMARAALPAPPDADVYRRLRAQTPPAAVRDAAPWAELDAGWRRADGSVLTWPAELAPLGLARMPVAAEDRLVVARGAGQPARIYLERLAGCGAGDSGWYIGSVDNVVAPGYDAVRVADMLAARSDLAPLLELPPGCLVVLDGTRLEALLDAEDKRVWPAANVGPS